MTNKLCPEESWSPAVVVGSLDLGNQGVGQLCIKIVESVFFIDQVSHSLGRDLHE